MDGDRVMCIHWVSATHKPKAWVAETQVGGASSLEGLSVHRVRSYLNEPLNSQRDTDFFHPSTGRNQGRGTLVSSALRISSSGPYGRSR